MTNPQPTPPGSTAEQLPEHMLRLIDVPDCTSTACVAARECERVVDVHTGHADGLRAAADRLHQRCRRNNKFTGVMCGCTCHAVAETPPACPGETTPPTCACPCEGCRHHCGALQSTPHAVTAWGSAFDRSTRLDAENLRLRQRLDAIREYATGACAAGSDGQVSASWVLHLLGGTEDYRPSAAPSDPR
ncbi:hypothetical protein [Streptomyces sp. NPDC054784]